MNTATPLRMILWEDSFNRKLSLVAFSAIVLFIGGVVAVAVKSGVEPAPHIIQLPPHTKFVSASFQGGKLWYSYRPAKEGEKPETVIFTNDAPSTSEKDNYYFNEE